MSEQKELLQAAKVLGIEGIDEYTPASELRKQIAVKLGNPEIHTDADEDQETLDARTDSMAKQIAAGATVARKTGPIVAEDGSIPNLTPNGDWQGKRFRLRRNSTGNNDMNGAIFKWNGWPTIVPIDVVVDVAYPIYEVIKGCTGMSMEITNEIDPKDSSRVITHKIPRYYKKYPFEPMGVTPGTEHLPESPWEYTLDAYVEDFEGFSVINWRQMCTMWELNNDYCKVTPGMGPEDEIQARKNALHARLNLSQGIDREARERARDHIRAGIGMGKKAA